MDYPVIHLIEEVVVFDIERLVQRQVHRAIEKEKFMRCLLGSIELAGKDEAVVPVVIGVNEYDWVLRAEIE